MLVLQRKQKQSICIGDDITITILESGSDGVKIAIDAPKEISILRGELMEAKKANQEASCSAGQKMEDVKQFYTELMKKAQK